MNPDFLIVGLGASAGGIGAIKRFFEHVPADSGAAYVVILHLSPDHDSHLAEVLQVSTSLPVSQVQGPVRVEPDHVYVIAPNRSLSMLDGHLALSEMTRIEERRAPVDIFFRTLAESHGSRAVCVVLSGTGANGSMGMKRVKEMGGICLVQDPDEAEYSDMPRNSIATTLVDHILPVAEIPARILAYKETLAAVRLPDEPAEPPPTDEQALREIFLQLRTRTGHDFWNYKRATVLRRIARRMGIHELTTVPEYTRFIREHPEEVQKLLKDLLISVTNFFRDRNAFEALELNVVPKLFTGKREDGQVRVWVPGCATGEEAYSVAMLLSEHAATLAGAPAIQVFATDIDETAIAAAREGRYTLNDAADVSPERLRRFFIRDGDAYRVRKDLREMLLFAHHNIIKDPPFSHLDLISCRNLLIYLNRTAQQRVVEIVHFALNPGGFLFVGSSEVADASGDLFVPFDKDAHVFRSRAVTSRIGLPVSDFSTRIRGGGRAPEDQPGDMPAVERFSAADLHQRLLEQYAAPSLLVNQDHEIVHLSERAGLYLQYTGGDPSHSLLKAVRPELRAELRTALYQAAQQRTAVAAGGVPVRFGDRTATVNVIVRPVLRDSDTTRGFFLVLFEETAGGADAAAPPVKAADDGARPLEEELVRVKGQLQATIERHETQAEELKASNEELQAMNEELRSSAEELETSKEELQSLNEELSTVNQELKTKIEEQAQANDDIQNLINSADIGTIFLDRTSRIKLFTPSARELFNLIPADYGRPLSDINSRLLAGDLAADVDRVLDRLERVERELNTRDGRWYLMRAVPYRTADDRIDGVVLTFVDITERKRAEAELIGVKEALETELASMTLLHELSTRLLETGELQPLLEEVLSASTKIQNADFGTIQLSDPETGKLRIVAQRGFGSDSLAEEAQQIAYMAAANVALERRQRVVVEDTAADPDYGPYRDLAAAIGYRAVQYTPLFSRRGIALGVLATHLRSPARPSPRDLRLMDLYARQAAEVIGFTREQDALRQSEKRLRRALEVDTVGVLFFRRDGTITHANDAFLRMSGYSRSDLQQHALDTLAASPKSLVPSAQALDEFDATGRIPAYEKEYVRKDGTRGWALMAAALLDGHEGVEFVIDMTQARQAEQQLRQTKARLGLIADSVTDYAIFTTDKDGCIDTWNPAAAGIFGFSVEEVIGRPAAILFTAEDQERRVPQEEMRQAHETGRASDDRWHVRKDGSRFFASGIMSPLLDDQDNLIGFVKIARDLTERKRWEDTLQHAHVELEARVAERTEALATANRALDLELRERREATERIRALMGRLITVQEDERKRIARDLHDHFGQQVAALKLKLEVLEQAVRPNEAQSAALADTQTVISKLDRDLDFFIWELRPAALDDLGLVVTLANFVREWSKNFEIAADFHTSGLDGTRLTYDIETNLYRITQEALNNIYKHAIARRAGVMLERRGEQVVLIVEDDGQGLKRAENSPGPDKGIGIVGMRERAALVGGTLELETTPGRGTTVFVRVPLTVARDSAADEISV